VHRSRRLPAIVVALALAAFALREGASHAGDSTATVPSAAGVPRALFLASWTTLFVRTACAPDGYFRQCFAHVGDAECNQLITTASNNCIQQYLATIPDPIPHGQGAGVGQMLGSCAGSSYEIALTREGRRINSAACNDPSRWVPRH
jgi:hypothetical protein